MHNGVLKQRYFLYFSRVHISKVTLNHLDDAYDVQPVPEKYLDDFIREKGLETYWVVPKSSQQLCGNVSRQVLCQFIH